jgi:hypothetical protein
LENKRNQMLAASGDDRPREMPEHESREALSFLRSPNLIELVSRDFNQIGFIGEETSRVFCYLAQISRFLESPLGILIVSRSGAGKSSLQEAVLKFIPEEVLENYARLSGKALFYKKTLKHKVLAIAEDEGAQEAIYSIRILASEQKLAVSVAAVDPKTGEKRTEDFYVEGPTSVFWTSTGAEKLDFETRNRFCIVTIDESREQTRRILEKQRERESLEGALEAEDEEPIFKKHHNAQRLLRKIKVINPYARELTYADDNLLMRREQKKYLTLIQAIAFLHQYQREIKKGVTKSGREIEYIEVTLEDIALANKLAAEVLGRSLDELSPHTRTLLRLIRAMIDDRIKAGKRLDDLLFSRKELCAHTGWSYFQVRRPLEALLEMEYVIARKNGKSHQLLYELLWKGEGERGEKFLLGLIDVQELRKKFKK